MRNVNVNRELLVSYWLRTVRIGTIVTALVIGAMAVFLFLPHGREVHAELLAAILCAGAAGGLLVALLPWPRLFARGLGEWFLYGWSALDIVLVTAAIGVTGGGHSKLFIVYALTTVFFCASYPLRAQVALLVFTEGCYVLTVAGTGWHVTASALFIRLSMLAILTVLTNFLAAELMRQMDAQREARDRAERWALLLQTIASAARTMPLDPEGVAAVAIEAVQALGFETAALSVVEEEGDGSSYRILESRGLPAEFVWGRHPRTTGLVGRVLASGRTEVVEDYSEAPDAHPILREAGFRTVVAAPMGTDGRIEAVLVGGTRSRISLQSLELEAFELLAAQTGLALDKARRYQQTHLAVERLEELDRMKSDFLATVSHELRTPVTVIQGVGLTLERAWATLDEDTREKMVTGLASNARSLDSIINSLLDFSRLESGYTDARLEAVALGPLVEEALERLGTLFATHPVTARVETQLMAVADPVLVDRVVENLLSNAVKHTPSGTPVEVSVRRRGGTAVVGVADAGPGIAPRELPHLTERFFRGGDINNRPRGLGLGLALVQEMLELQGSTLEIVSEPGRGARFSFHLPIARETAGRGRDSMGTDVTTPGGR
jgi:signal transduction histidine kinase